MTFQQPLFNLFFQYMLTEWDLWCSGFQEGIRDKLRAIPIELSVAIQNAKRGKRQSSLPQLTPILDSAVPNKTITEVLSQLTARYVGNLMNSQYILSSTLIFIFRM